MRVLWNWRSPGLALGCLAGVFGFGSSPHGVAAGAVEPGLEQAVEWKWWVVPSEAGVWGIPIGEEKKADGSNAGALDERPAEYVVVRGDALAKIARKFDMTVWQLKKFNEMENDRIVIGQKLKIPNAVELLKLVPPPPPPPPEPVRRKGRKPANAVPEPPMPEESAFPEDQLENVRLQVFLDRQMYSPGMIDGKDGPLFQKVCEIYQKNNPDAGDSIRFKAKALSAVADPFAKYTLKIEDFSFIRTAKPEQAPQPAGRKGGAVNAKSGKGGAIAKEASAPPAIDRLMGEKFLSYQNGWEFVAERFHCDEAFLRTLNPLVKGDPVAGMELKVPAVEPFEIEKALDGEMQPAADPANPVVAAVVLVQRLEIWKGGRLVAVMPVAAARPGLCGRGSWTVMDAVPRPMLATKRESRETPKPPDVPAANPPVAGASPVALPMPPLEQEQHLAAGPNNPVGVCWIHLAKQGGKEPLPYGLHGTSIPGRMRTQQGIGGFRMTNWDIARAVRLIPKGTALQWRAR